MKCLCILIHLQRSVAEQWTLFGFRYDFAFFTYVGGHAPIPLWLRHCSQYCTTHAGAFIGQNLFDDVLNKVPNIYEVVQWNVHCAARFVMAILLHTHC